MVTPGPKYFALNAIRLVIIVYPNLRKIQAGLLKLPNVLVRKLPRYFANFTINFLQCRSFISMLMKHLKFVIAIPFKVLVQFYILMETIFEDWKQKYLQLSWNITYLGYKSKIMRVIFHA